MQETINKKIRICLECGDTAIRIVDKTANCPKCGKKFCIGEKNGSSL